MIKDGWANFRKMNELPPEVAIFWAPKQAKWVLRKWEHGLRTGDEFCDTEPSDATLRERFGSDVVIHRGWTV